MEYTFSKKVIAKGEIRIEDENISRLPRIFVVFNFDFRIFPIYQNIDGRLSEGPKGNIFNMHPVHIQQLFLKVLI